VLYPVSIFQIIHPNYWQNVQSYSKIVQSWTKIVHDCLETVQGMTAATVIP
jgi:hypothetical protein